jgi:dihydrofolate reductase
MQLHEWLFATRSFAETVGRKGGSEGLDDDFFSERVSGVGATIMGRNMFGPIRGPWGDSEWTGWWGEEPPLSSPGLRAHSPTAYSYRNAGGNNLPFR